MEATEMIVRRVTLDRNRSYKALEATGRKQRNSCVTIVDGMPKGEGDEVEVMFFKLDPLNHLDCRISNEDVEKEFELRGLKPADPISLLALNEADPAFADEKPYCTHWKDVKGNWYSATFSGPNDEHRMEVECTFDSDWSVGWWFAGIRK